uniref:Uncharacterized protein n=1 Tax=Rhizophora mucronata TaxID=61149 RepID=A0A2P2QIE2_RHIMU
MECIINQKFSPSEKLICAWRLMCRHSRIS